MAELEASIRADSDSGRTTNITSSHQKCSIKKVFLKISRKHLCQSLFLNKVAGLTSGGCF